MKSLILYLFVFFGLLSPTLAQSSDSEKEAVIQLSKTKWQWMADKEADKLAELFDDKSVFVHMGGTWGKNREVEIIRQGFIHYKDAKIYETSVEFIGNTALLLNRITLTAVVGGNEVVNPFMVMEVYIKKEEGWKMGGMSFTRLTMPNE